jgi:hypothetical protein
MTGTSTVRRPVLSVFEAPVSLAQYPNSISGVERSAGVPANVISKDCRVPENKPIIIVI